MVHIFMTCWNIHENVLPTESLDGDESCLTRSSQKCTTNCSITSH